MNPLKVILLVLFLLLNIAGIPAQETYKIQDPENYFSKKEKQTFEKAVNYEAMFYNRIFQDKRVDFSDVKFTVIPDQISYSYYIKEAGGPVRLNSPGVYITTRNELVVCMDKKFREGFIGILCHELSHAILHNHSGNKNIPAWLNEGLAVYLEEMTYDKKVVKHEKNSLYVARVLTLIELKDLNLHDFVSWDYRRFSSESFSQEGYGYAVGYCMVYFLLQLNEEKAFTIFRNLIGTQSTEEVFNQYYAGGFRQFEEDFMNYWKRYSY